MQWAKQARAESGREWAAERAHNAWEVRSCSDRQELQKVSLPGFARSQKMG